MEHDPPYTALRNTERITHQVRKPDPAAKPPRLFKYMKQFDEALTDCDQTLALAPELFIAVETRAALFLIQHQYEAAIGEMGLCLEKGSLDSYKY